MKLKNYHFQNNHILRLNFWGGKYALVALDEDSGRVVTRLKVGSVSEVQHPGIWLGTDCATGKPLILHNHRRQGGAYVATYQDYASGQEVFWKDDVCTNDWVTVVKIGLDHVIAGKRYKWFDYNCQTFTNTACHNEAKSEDVQKWVGRALGSLAMFLLVRELAKSI